MSGHSKWSQIKRKKGITDQKRGLVFSKLSKLITIAVKEGGAIGDPDKNVRLRLVISVAKSENMPKENIERAIEKGRGGGADSLKEAVYEGFGPAGGLLLIVAATDNLNRAHAEIKTTLEKNGGKMGNIHSVAYNFQKCGLVLLPKSTFSEEMAFELGEKLSVIDMQEDEESYIIYIPFEKIGEAKDVPVEIYYRPLVTVPLDEKDHDRVGRLLDVLEDLDDVSKVYTNYA